MLKGTYLSLWSIYFVNKIVLKIILELMLGKYGLVEEEEEPIEKPPTIHYHQASMVVEPRMALMSANDHLISSNTMTDEHRQTSNLDNQQAIDEGIVEDLSKFCINFARKI